MSRRAPVQVPAPRSDFADFRFPPDVIMVVVRWYLRYGLMARDEAPDPQECPQPLDSCCPPSPMSDLPLLPIRRTHLLCCPGCSASAHARSFGCETVDVSAGPLPDQIEQILGVAEVDAAVDAVGFEARGGKDGREAPPTVLNAAM